MCLAGSQYTQLEKRHADLPLFLRLVIGPFVRTSPDPVRADVYAHVTMPPLLYEVLSPLCCRWTSDQSLLLLDRIPDRHLPVSIPMPRLLLVPLQAKQRRLPKQAIHLLCISIRPVGQQ